MPDAQVIVKPVLDEHGAVVQEKRGTDAWLDAELAFLAIPVPATVEVIRGKRRAKEARQFKRRYYGAPDVERALLRDGLHKHYLAQLADARTGRQKRAEARRAEYVARKFGKIRDGEFFDVRAERKRKARTSVAVARFSEMPREPKPSSTNKTMRLQKQTRAYATWSRESAAASKFEAPPKR